MNRLTIALSLLSFFLSKGLFKAPQLINRVDIERLKEDWHTEFNWYFHWPIALGITLKGDFSCFYENKESSFCLKLNSFALYSYKIKNTSMNPDCSDYYYEKPLHFTNQLPQALNVEQLKTLINNKNIVFYTGAGISALSVPAMNQLEHLCCLDQGKWNFFKTVVLHPDKISQGFAQFCHLCIDALPTLAHQALHTLAQKKRCAIITENVDLLHEQAGSLPIHFDGKGESISFADMNCLDAIICVGLSHDDRGLLAYYKKYNPQGIIIAIDMKQPSYLSSQDFLLEGDIQSVLPELVDN